MTVQIAVDVGGTQIRAASYRRDSLEPLHINRITTQGETGTPLERVAMAVESVWPEGESVTAVAVAAPGPIDPYKGIIYTAPNIPGWHNLPIGPILEERLRVPVLIGNDANLAALGEWKYGAAEGHHHVLFITVSTGIGTGIITNDQLLLGAHGLAGEMGHMTVDPSGPLCGCGRAGHLESFASGTAIARWTESQLEAGRASTLPRGQKLSARVIAEAAERGDVLAIAAFHRAGTYLGYGIADLLHAFNPSVVVLGGGVSRSGELLLEPMRSAIRERIISPFFLEDLTITRAALGDDAGLLGALALARSNERKFSPNVNLS